MFDSIFKILSSSDVRGVFHVFSGKWVRSSIALSLLLYAYGVLKNTASFIAKGEYVSIVTYYVDSDIATKNRQTTYILRYNYINSLNDQNLDKKLADVGHKDGNKAFYIPFYIIYCMGIDNRRAFSRDSTSTYNINTIDKNFSQAQTNKFCEFTRKNYQEEDFEDYVDNLKYDWKLWLLPKYISKHVIDTVLCGSYGLIVDIRIIGRNFTFERNHSCNIL